MEKTYYKITIILCITLWIGIQKAATTQEDKVQSLLIEHKEFYQQCLQEEEKFLSESEAILEKYQLKEILLAGKIQQGDKNQDLKEDLLSYQEDIRFFVRLIAMRQAAVQNHLHHLEYMPGATPLSIEVQLRKQEECLWQERQAVLEECDRRIKSSGSKIARLDKQICLARRKEERNQAAFAITVAAVGVVGCAALIFHKINRS